MAEIFMSSSRRMGACGNDRCHFFCQSLYLSHSFSHLQKDKLQIRNENSRNECLSPLKVGKEQKVSLDKAGLALPERFLVFQICVGAQNNLPQLLQKSITPSAAVDRQDTRDDLTSIASMCSAGVCMLMYSIDMTSVSGILTNDCDSLILNWLCR